MTTAFVLSGGAAHGAVQAGMLMALDERNIRPDLIVGTSDRGLPATLPATPILRGWQTSGGR